MKFILLIVVFFFSSCPWCAAQNLSGLLEGYTFTKTPSDKSVVGSKWVKGIGATTEGLSGDEIVIAKSLNQYSFDKSTLLGIEATLKAILGLEGFSSNEISLSLNNMEVVSVKNLYKLPLTEGEMFVFEALRVKSFDLSYGKELEAGIRAKIPTSVEVVDISAGGSNKKRKTFKGDNLFVAYKIIKLTDVTSNKKTKKISENFEVKNLSGYDFLFNNSALIRTAITQTKEALGEETYDNLTDISSYILKYSRGANVKTSVVSQERGDLATGVFKTNVSFCYCSIQGSVEDRIFLLNSTNRGDRITLDYLIIEDYGIVYKKSNFVKLKTGEDFMVNCKPTKSSKISVLTKIYTIANIH